MKNIPEGVFKRKLSTGEKKSDLTTAVALQILEGEKAAREAKTERLRSARVAYEEAHPVIAPVTKKARLGKRRLVSRSGR